MEIRKFENLEDWYIVNECKDTRHGFKHVSTLIHYNSEVATESCYYLNRTWECYRYQTSMRAVVNKRIREIQGWIVEDYKNQNNVKRLTKKHKEALEAQFAEDARLKDLEEIYRQLEYSR